MPDNYGEDVGLEMKHSSNPPTKCSSNFVVDFIWKGTSFDRMQQALRKFAVDDNSVSNFIYSRLLGHSSADDMTFRIGNAPKHFSAPNLPDLNRSQVYAVKHAIQRPLSLIQGPPGKYFFFKFVIIKLIYFLIRNWKNCYISNDRLSIG